MTWNYRLIKSDKGYSIHEVYYDANGKPIASTLNPIMDFYCESPEDLMYELDLIKKAFESPPIDENDIGRKK